MNNRKENNTKTVAFVTYNTVGDGLSSGWHNGPDGRRALVLQNTTGAQWAVSPPGYGIHADRVESMIDILWKQLQEALPGLDQLVVYVGDHGSERAIKLASSLPSSKVTFVGCSCNGYAKRSRARSAGLTEARWMNCECGGHGTMKRLFQRFMETGAL